MEDEYETPDVVFLYEPFGQFLEGSPYWDIYLPNFVSLTNGDNRYFERLNETENGYVWGLDGDDEIWTKSFGVSIDAGKGDDTIIWSYQPPALIDGGEGNDTLDLSLLPRGAKVDLSNETADTLVPLFYPLRPVEVRNIENVIGTDYDDQITGNSAKNLLMGGDGGDILNGLGGDDALHGGASTNGSRDILIGGSGADQFIFNTAEEDKLPHERDVVVDFEQGTDKLVFQSNVVVPSIEFRGANYVSPDTRSLVDPTESYLKVAHSSQPGMTETTEVLLLLSRGFDHEFSAITLVGHHDLTPSDFMFV